MAGYEKKVKICRRAGSLGFPRGTRKIDANNKSERFGATRKRQSDYHALLLTLQLFGVGCKPNATSQ